MQIKYRVDLNKLLPENPVTCEVGVAQGLFSRDICTLWNPKLHYCVDAWTHVPQYSGDGAFPEEWHNMNYHTAIWNMYPFRHKVTFIKGMSWHMASQVKDGSLDLLYLDANHSFEGVTKDLNAWFNKVKVSGVIAGHDYINKDYGVFGAVNDFARLHGLVVNTIQENKDEDAGFYMIKNNYAYRFP